MERERYREMQQSAYQMEHWGAWLLALGAVTLGILGILAAFEIVEFRDYGHAGQAQQGLSTVASESFWDGLVFLIPGLTAAVLALTLHMNDHHRMHDPRRAPDMDTNLWNFEHMGAYALALLSLVLGAIAILTGFGTFGDADQRDGVIWGLTSLGSGILTATLHSVRHHKVAAEEDYMTAIVNERVAAGRTGQMGPSAERRV